MPFFVHSILSCSSNKQYNIFFYSASMKLKLLSTAQWYAHEDTCKSLNANWRAMKFYLEQFQKMKSVKLDM